ncbi:MAG TPA: hypothetical protein VLA99_10695, partial [Nitrospiraceae bacterium]|nr:hypothetical protein [Nitrospiraceae bacterium]
IFLRFSKTKAATIRRLIKRLAQATYRLEGKDFHYLASAREQALLGDMVRDTAIDDPKRKTYIINVYLSKKGYDALQVPGAKVPPDPSFRGGLASFLKALRKQGKLQDPTKDWDKAYNNIHAMIAIAHNEQIQVNGKRVVLNADTLLQDLINVFTPYVVTIEKGKVLYNSDDRRTNEVIEHFGFRDGISNPVFFMEEWEKRRSEDINQQVDKFDSAAPLRLALAEDPGCRKGAQAYGSYLVFGKLEQNVRAFEDDIQQLAQSLTPNPQIADPNERVKRAKALVLGRYQDGTPITLRDRDGGVPNKHGGIAASPNNFDFSDDPWSPTGAGRCPIHSHIRRSNPRGEAVRVKGEDSTHRIVRRGIPYGDREKEPKDGPTRAELPTGDVGLLFMCFQGSIGFQFEHIIDEWCLYPDHPDAVMRDSTGAGTHRSNYWPTQWHLNRDGGIKSVECPFPKHVYLKGGEYFFAPSIPFLKSL